MKSNKDLALNKLSEAKLNVKNISIEVNYLNKKLNESKKQYEKTLAELDSIIHKIIKAFSSSSTNIEKKIESATKELASHEKQKSLLIFSLSETEEQLILEQRKYDEAKRKIDSFIQTFKSNFFSIFKFSQITNELTEDNWPLIMEKLSNVLEEEKESIYEDKQLFDEYNIHPVSTDYINEQLRLLNTAKEKIKSSTTEEKLKSVKVIACTLDGYIGRFVEDKLKVDHIFLDEAGYACMVKALTLFNHDVPITFLGDHKQLPPVCEVNDDKIKNNDEYRNIFLWGQSAIFIESLFNKSSRDIALNEYLSNKRLESERLICTSLTSTYRFGTNLASVLDKHVYKNSFGSASKNGEFNIQVVHAKKTDSYRSRISRTEADAIKNIISQLKIDDYIILTLYVKQIKILGDYLPQQRNELKILTVHGSQGREWDTVIFSVVDTHDMFFVDTTSTISKGLNLINTAVSRAKKELIIVCDTDFWLNQTNQLITDLIYKNYKQLNHPNL